MRPTAGVATGFVVPKPTTLIAHANSANTAILVSEAIDKGTVQQLAIDCPSDASALVLKFQLWPDTRASG